MQLVRMSIEMADPVGEETKSSSIMFVNLNGNCPRRINPNDAAGMPEAPEAFFLKQLSLGNRWIQS